jgi:sorting nexin-4
MRFRPTQGNPQSTDGGGGVFDGLTDTFLNAFSKVHKPDRRFIEVRDRADNLDDALTHVEKIIARVVRREADLESDYADLSKEFLKIVELEPDLEPTIRAFAVGVKETSDGLKQLKEHTDQDYLSSLRDMEAYILSLKQLLKTREQKQLDFEGLTDYLNRAQSERDHIASAPAGSTGLGGPTGFLRSKIEDVRGVDHEASRRDRVRKLEHRIDELTREVEKTRKTAESFDEEVVREVADFERIKSTEMKDTLGGLAGANVRFYKEMVETWENMLKQLDEGEEMQQQQPA